MKKRLELRVESLMDERLDRFSAHCECNKSDVIRAALKLGLDRLLADAGSTGLPLKSWIAALNGKVK